MPSGRTHDRITLICLPLVVLTSLILTRSSDITLTVASAFLFSGMMFGPDLDIHSVQTKRWGWFQTLWLPYRQLLRHRSWFSHGLIVGTVIRLIYLGFWLSLVAIFTVAIAQSLWGFEWNWRDAILRGFYLLRYEYPTQAIALFVGLELGATSHSLSDWIGSALKRRRSTRKRH